MLRRMEPVSFGCATFFHLKNNFASSVQNPTTFFVGDMIILNDSHAMTSDIKHERVCLLNLKIDHLTFYRIPYAVPIELISHDKRCVK